MILGWFRDNKKQKKSVSSSPKGGGGGGSQDWDTIPFFLCFFSNSSHNLHILIHLFINKMYLFPSKHVPAFLLGT